MRIPDIVMGDLNAQLAACTVGARRLGELAETYGDNHLGAIFEELLDRSETMTRAGAARDPGRAPTATSTTSTTTASSSTGRSASRSRSRSRTAPSICDFTGTSPQVQGPFNCVPSGSQAAAYFAVRALTDPDAIPTNGGCFRPVALQLPEGSLVNPREPAPVNARTATIKRIAGCILGALKEVLPEQVPADACGELLALMFGGQRRDGARYRGRRADRRRQRRRHAQRRRRRDRDRCHATA